MEQEKEIIALIEKYKSGGCSDQEIARLESWYLKRDPEAINELSAQEFEMHLTEMGKGLPLVLPVRKQRLWPKIAITAAVATIIFGAGLYYFNGSSDQKSKTIESAALIAPGRQGATLTLANGKQIRLSTAGNGKLASQAGVIISKTQDGQLVYQVESKSGSSGRNTLSTAKGETYMVRLPEGSLVWLNAASSLSYDASLNENGKRLVSLTGEAYFQVAKDKAHPFVVKTAQQSIEVLGTHFNVSAYPEDKTIKSTLLEGSVKLTAAVSGQLALLKPGQQSELYGGKFKVAEANTEEAIAWQKGYFTFDDESIQSIMTKISRWYNVEITYEGKIPEDGFNAAVNRFGSISELLDVLESTKVVKFKIEGRRIIVSQ